MNRRSLINPIVVLMLLVASAGPTTSARAEPIAATASTATVTLTAVADAALRSDAPDTPFGSYSALEIGYALRPAAETVTLVRFDLSSLPFGAVIDAASLELYLIGASGASTVSIGAYALTGSWNETTVTWNSCPTAAAIGIASPIDSAAGSYKSWPATSFASSWLANPGANYGVLLRGPTDGTVFDRGFESREHNEHVPRLVITYHVAPYSFTGGVFEGAPPDTSRPLAGVEVGLWGDQDEWPEGGIQRTFIMSATTGADGTFSLQETLTQLWPFLHVIEIDPAGAVSTGAQVAPPGYVKNLNVVSYEGLLPGTYGGIRFWDSLPSALPDLVVTEVRPEGARICTQIRNIGAGPAAAGHIAALRIDDAPYATLTVGELLEPGQRFDGCFDAAWSCTSPQDHVVVIADHLGVIEESDETNNLHEIVLACDTTPPHFVSGPAISQVTATSALLSWASDEPAEGHIRYGPHAVRAAVDLWTDGMASSYAILLADLQPATVYHLQVDLYDGAGNQTLGQALLFETLPPPDSVNPVVNLVIPSTLTKTVVVQANATDNTGVQRVEFYVGGDLAFIDYSPPFTMALDSTRYPNGPLQVTAKAIDLANRSAQAGRSPNVVNLIEAGAPVVVITAPANDAHVSGIVKVTAQLSDDVGLLNARFYVDGVYTAFEGWPAESAPKSATVTFDWDARALERPEHYSLAVEAYDTSFKATSQVIRVWVQPYVEPPTPPRPDLIVTGHTVARFQNRFTVQLTVKNVGDAAATDVRILDGLRGFQPIASAGTAYDVVTRWEPVGVFAMADIRDHGTIPAGQSRIYTYKALPVMIHPDPPTPQIGSFTDLNWSSSTQVAYHRYLTLPVAKDNLGQPIPTSHLMATMSSDYVLVTNPYRLFAFHAPAYKAGGQAATDVNQVLATMAELAWHKNGVLGYMNQGDAGTLNTLIRPGGDWVLRMGWIHVPLHILIVGETNIVGSYWTKGWDIKWSDDTTTDVVNNTDQPIANTAGDWRPEWVLGRIIGDAPTDLTMVLRRSIQVHLNEQGHTYDHSHALSVSGTGNGESTMVSGAKLTAGALTTKGYAVSTLHLSTIADTQQMAALTPLLLNRDFIYYFQHGNPNSMGPLTTWNMGNVSFGTAHPVVLAASCLTGDYVNGSLAEAFFDQGTGAYIGSTEVSPMSVNKVCGRDLVNASLTSASAGRALFDLERSYWGFGKWYRFWAYEYNYYGDPKYGAPTTAAALAPATAQAVAVPTTTLHVDVPVYELDAVDGLDHVTIPGGALWLEPGDYEIPFFVTTLDVPPGTQVQDVTLVAKGDVITATDLHLPVATAEISHLAGAGRAAVGDGALPFVGRDFEWRTTDRVDGGSEVAIVIYPFLYNPQTAGVTFTRGWEFEVLATASAVAITALEATPRSVPVGAPLGVSLEIENTGPAQDLVVSGLVRRLATGEVWDGLLLHALKGLTGPASFAATWETESYPVGDYEVEVTLTTMQGTLVAQRTAPFTLGIVTGRITAFSAGPSGFTPGDPLGIALTFVNWSDVAVSGQVRVAIHDAEDTLLQSYSEDFGPLAPDMTVSFNETWTTPASGTGELHVTGAVLFSGTATGPITIIVTPQQMIYLPLVMRQ